MKRLAIGLAVLAIGCAPPVTPRVAKPSPPRVVAPIAPGKHIGAPPAEDESAAAVFRQPIALPGCDDKGVASVRERLEAIDRRLRPRTIDGDVDAIMQDLLAVWRHPCLGHVARVFPPPWKMTAEALRGLWQYRLHGALLSMVGALYMRDGKRYFIVPPMEAEPVTLKASDQKTLAPWLCPDRDARCGRAPSFMARAERVFDREQELALRWHGIIVGAQGPDALSNSYLSTDDRCAPRPPPPDEPQKLTPFEEFIVCAATSAPRTWRYPKNVKLRARESGWLVLRGRRGHYSFSDEIRAYDLATGAAYVARSESALVLGGPRVDFDAVDKQRKPEAFTGTVSAEQARELAFVLGTASLVRASRSEIQLVPVPADLQATFTPGRGFDVPLEVPENEWGSSAHTQLAWSLVENGQTIAEGSVLWPSSWRAADSHADELLRVLEAGLAKGCAPARLPGGIAHGTHGKVSAIDADPNAQDVTFGDLAKRLEGLGDRVCR